MAAYNKKPKVLKAEIPPEYQELFGQFNTLCVIKEKRPIEYFAELVATEVALNQDVLQGQTWLKWDDFEAAMRGQGITLNRVTMWTYRNKGLFPELVKTDGVTTLFQLEGFLEYFKSGAAAAA